MPAGLWAQGSQNSDMYLLLGPATIKSQTVPGTNIALSRSTGLQYIWGYGYQLKRTKVGGFWLEVAPFMLGAANPHTIATPSTAVNLSSQITNIGLRFMVPVHPRISFYGAAGGGPGFFSYPVQGPPPAETVQANDTVHGVVDFGGGIDLRLNHRFSIRAEVRDFVTGRGLSGVAGPNHIVPVAGFVLHF